MFITDIEVRREGYYGGSIGIADVSKPFVAKIGVKGQFGRVELILSPDLCQKMVALIADAVAEAGKTTAEAMTAEALTVAANTGKVIR